jgi:putative transposase
MESDLNTHHRKSIRLKNFDYSQPGAYFVTTNIQDRKQLLGKIVEGQVTLNEIGRIVENVWMNLPSHYQTIDLDDYCVMPDHFHGIIIINDIEMEKQHTLSEIVRGFKTFSSRGVNLLPGFKSDVFWQRNYYEHVVRDEEELNRIRQYIIDNPLRWSDGNGDIEPSRFFR